MQLQTIVIFAAGLVATASAIPGPIAANPAVKHIAARAINVADGSFAGLIFKRQNACPEGFNSCGSGCTPGPCCDNDSGLACRAGEVCTQVNGETGCCADGYVCGAIRGCQDAGANSCTPGDVDGNGVMCCDDGAPVCSTSAGLPICAATPSTTIYTVFSTATDAAAATDAAPTDAAPTDAAPTDATATDDFDTTSTTSTTMTSTITLTLDSNSNVIPPATDVTGTDGSAPAPTSPSDEPPVGGAEPTTTETDVTIQTTDVSAAPTQTLGAGSGEDTTSTEEAVSTTTSVLVLPYPTPIGNGTGNATATSTPSPPEATGAAGKLGVSGFALTIAMGLLALVM
ncbi:hypothetical protein TWF696_004208 [Orbilia brochopaga]|uniref:Uncharacterized protein n=1 Tax=Orbilia brochopaga TaxID=3140254 RepID=A0AAV9V6N1_9PEZI